MISPLAPTAEDVRKLDDKALRELIIQLAEAELTLAERFRSGVLAGGNQNAPDDGLDLRIEDSGPGLPFLPAFPAGLQVKATTMARAGILAEMRPGGAARPVLAELAARGGAYLILSGRDNCADRALQARLAAMREAVADVPQAEQLKLDFLDASRLAQWARRHPGVALWLADTIGAPTLGWKPYGPWSAPNLAKAVPYLADGSARAIMDFEDPLAPAEVLEKLRVALSSPRAAVRLVGLSGMGKTRLAQALFEGPADRDSYLHPALAVYGDAAAALGVEPEVMAQRLVASRSPAVLIVDNCPGDLHRRLATTTQTVDSVVRLVTIDFDIERDRPDGTAVVRLEPAGGHMIEQLLRYRAPRLSSADRSRIVDFSNGNARVALALAGARGNLAQLEDRDLMDRLFLTARRTSDELLRRVARAASLFNAFEIEAAAGEVAVIARLANLDEFTVREKVGDLLDRGLAQQRGVQRAILPHALAVRLAGELLPRLDREFLWDVASSAPKRLFRSFIRRLSLLHDEPVAFWLAGRILDARDSLIGDLMTQEAWEDLAHLAVLEPDRVLAVAVDAAARSDPEDETFRWLIRERLGELLLELAYGAERFKAAADALLNLMNQTTEPRWRSSDRAAFVALFQPANSNTMAPPQPRFEMIADLVRSADPARRELGLQMLNAALTVEAEARGVRRSLGARPRTGGWRPVEEQDWAVWVEAAIGLARDLMAAPGVRELFEPRYANALARMLQYDVLRSLAIAALENMAAGGFSRPAWYAVCRRLNARVSAGHEPDEEVVALEVRLRPRSLPDRYEAWVLGDPADWREPTGEQLASWDGFASHSKALGRDLASDVVEARRLLQMALSTRSARGFGLGEGLGEAVAQPDDMWRELCDLFRKAPEKARNVTPLLGFLKATQAREPDLAALWLASASQDPALRPHVVNLQLAVGQPDEAAAHRMLKALRDRSAAPETFSVLQNGRATYAIPNDLLAEIIRELMATPGGIGPALGILHMRYHGAKEVPLDGDLRAVGREVLEALEPADAEELRAGEIREIGKVALAGLEAQDVVRRLAVRLADASLGPQVDRTFTPLVAVLLQRHPHIMLEALFGGPEDRTHLGYLLDSSDSDDHPDDRALAAVPDDVVMAWIADNPGVRAPNLAPHVGYFRRDEDNPDVFAWTPLALWMLELPGQELAVARIFERRFHVGSWSGSSAGRYERRRPLVQTMLGHENPLLAGWAKEVDAKLEAWITARRESDAMEHAFE
jgi:hypothetical protein